QQGREYFNPYLRIRSEIIMTMWRWRSTSCLIGFGAFMGFSALSSTATTLEFTFHKDVLPILQRKCQTCHRPGDIAPMPFLTYEQTRPWAKAIRSAVLRRVMPPWHADPEFGMFSNDRSLTSSETKKLVEWANNGAPEGSPADAPPPRIIGKGRCMEKPELVYEMLFDLDAHAISLEPDHWRTIPPGSDTDAEV